MTSAIQIRIVGAAILFAMFVLPVAIVCAQGGQHDDLPDPDFDFKTFFVTRPGLTEPAFEQYLDDAKPEIVQVGYYGPMLHGYGDAPGATGYPMNLPARGVDELLQIFRDVNAKVHHRGLKVVGHFQTGKVIGTWEDKSFFYDFYLNKWDEKLLGPKPHPDVLEIVQRDAQGNPLEQGRNATTRYVGLCLSSPHTRQMLKQMLKVAVDAGVDGLITNFNYRWDCVCPYCVQLFRAHLDDRFTDEQLASRFGISDISSHVFESIPASIPGYPEPDAPPLTWEAKRWGALQFKAAFDEIMIEYGRSLKPDLIVATWNHIGNVGHVEERTFLPIDLWGKGENYFWYSGGAAFVNKNYNQAEGKVGDAWLLTHYLRELGSGKPFVLGKYDRMRMRTSIAEAAATGGGGMGRYMRFLDPLACERLVRYTRFVHEHRALYDDAKPLGEIALLLPRQSVLAGMPDALATFRQVGETLVRDQMLIEVVADENLAEARLKDRPMLIVADARCLSDAQGHVIESYAQSGGSVLLVGDVGTHDETGAKRDTALSASLAQMPRVHAVAADDAQALQAHIARIGGDGLSDIGGPWTLRASAYETQRARVLHLVNYAYDQEKLAALGRTPGAEGELPVPEHDIAVALRVAADRPIAEVLLHQPEDEQPVSLDWLGQGGRLHFTVDRVIVYAVVEIRYADSR